MGFLHGEEVGQGLTGMLQIGEGIDHRHRGPVGVVHQFLLSEGANRQHIAVTAQNPGRVFQRLAAAELGDGRIEIHRLAAEAGHGHLKTHTGSGGGLAEDQTQHTVAEIDPTIAALQLCSQIQQRCCFLGGTIRRGKEVTSAQRREDSSNARRSGSHRDGSKDCYRG